MVTILTHTIVKNIRTLVALAGLDDIVEVVVGQSSESIKTMFGIQTAGNKVDMLFLDHHKPMYIQDLKICESLGVVGQGTVLVADNVIYPGNPQYLKYVRSSVEEKRTAFSQEVEESQMGNPNLEYKSELKESFEPSGEPVSSSCHSIFSEKLIYDRMELRSLFVLGRKLRLESDARITSKQTKQNRILNLSSDSRL